MATWLIRGLVLFFLLSAPMPPSTRTDAVKEVLHGIEIIDPYRWLEDQQSPETRTWIDTQNRYTRSFLDPLPSRNQLRQRLTELLRVDVVSAPRTRNGRYFFTKRLANQDLSVIYLREGLDGKDEVLIDPHGMSPDHTISVSFLDVSNDGNLLAYGIREGGQDEYSIRFFDVKARRDLPDQLPRARYFFGSLTPDNKALYYVRQTPEGPRVYQRALGSSEDKLIFGQGYGRDKIITVDLSEDGRYLLIGVSHGSAPLKTEVYLYKTEAQSRVTVVNDIDARFYGHMGGDRIYLHTNWKAPNGRILAAPLDHPSKAHWREIIPESSEALEDVTLAAEKLFVSYLRNASTRLTVSDAEGKGTTDVPLPAPGTAGITGRWSSDEVFLSFVSFHIPSTIYRLEDSRNSRYSLAQIWSKSKVPLNSDNFEVKQTWYESKDKTRIPMFIVHRKNLDRNVTHPTLLSGYGGFNVSRTPNFSSTIALWIEQGGIYALPNLRGGGEFGEAWHQAGMLDKKQNVFDDFVSAAEWLIANGYTDPSKLAISGRSNGGLLVGAALTQRPELFRAVICGYPLLDMVRYHKFLVARFWVSEYGSSEDPEQFKYIHAYSPYHNVKPGTKYPAILFVTGDGDTRVDPLHARKMAALLQSAAGSDRPVLLRYDTKAGHSAGMPVSEQIEELTDELSFLLWRLE